MEAFEHNSHTDGHTYYEFCKHHGIYIGAGEVVQKITSERRSLNGRGSHHRHECFPLQDVVDFARKYVDASDYSYLHSTISCQHLANYLSNGEQKNFTQTIKKSLRMSLCWAPTIVTVVTACTFGPVEQPLIELCIIAAVSLATVGGVIGSITTLFEGVSTS